MVKVLSLLKRELFDFCNPQGVIDIVRSGDYSSLQTLHGITAVIAPLFPLLLVLEMATALFRRQFRASAYKIPFFIYVFHRLLGRYISLSVTAFCVGFFQPLARFHTSVTWYWFIYAYLVWEFAHFIYHYLCHKVRLFWCLHSTHHAPEQMNLSVTYAHFFLELPFADFIRASISMLFGINPVLLFAVMVVDGTWGAFIHVGEGFLKDGNFGFLKNWILTPSHHRVHHARNPLYIDTNFCNLILVWDKLFKTYQAEHKGVAIEYGVTRPINANSFFDVYFGEFYFLWKDLASAPGIINKLLYALMPPGWKHSGNHRTASAIRREYVKMLQTAIPSTSL